MKTSIGMGDGEIIQRDGNTVRAVLPGGGFITSSSVTDILLYEILLCLKIQQTFDPKAQMYYEGLNELQQDNQP